MLDYFVSVENITTILVWKNITNIIVWNFPNIFSCYIIVWKNITIILVWNFPNILFLLYNSVEKYYYYFSMEFS